MFISSDDRWQENCFNFIDFSISFERERSARWQWSFVRNREFDSVIHTYATAALSCITHTSLWRYNIFAVCERCTLSRMRRGVLSLLNINRTDKVHRLTWPNVFILRRMCFSSRPARKVKLVRHSISRTIL